MYRGRSYDQFPILDGVQLGQHEHHDGSGRHVCHERREEHLVEAIVVELRGLFRRELQPTCLIDLKSLRVYNVFDLLPVDHRFRLHNGQSTLDILFLLDRVLSRLAEADRRQFQAIIFSLVGAIAFRRTGGFVLQLSAQLLPRDQALFFLSRWLRTVLTDPLEESMLEDDFVVELLLLLSDCTTQFGIQLVPSTAVSLKKSFSGRYNVGHREKIVTVSGLRFSAILSPCSRGQLHIFISYKLLLLWVVLIILIIFLFSKFIGLLEKSAKRSQNLSDFSLHVVWRLHDVCWG